MSDCSEPYSFCVSQQGGSYEYRPGATTGIPTFGTVDGPYAKFSVASADALSVTLQWQASSSSSSYVRVPLVYGSPFVTAVYHNLRPYMTKPPGPALLLVNGTDLATLPDGALTLTTDALNWTLATSTPQNWVFYTSSPVTWSCTVAGCSLPDNNIVIRVAHNPGIVARALALSRALIRHETHTFARGS